MCADQGVPAAGHFEFVQSTLDAYEQLNEARDVLTLDPRVGGTPDEIVDSFNEVVSNLDPSSVEERMLNRGRISVPYGLPSDYENIFQYPGLSRRTERTAPTERRETCLSVEELMSEWVAICLEEPSLEGDKVVPGGMEPFEHLMVHHMPMKLDMNTWIAGMMMKAATQKINSEIQIAGEVHQCQDGMTDDTQILYRRLPSGLYQDVIYFAGEAKPGRLVWVPQARFDLPFGHGRAFCRKVRAMLRAAEEALVALARRVARHVAECIVYQYLAPEVERRGHSILNRKQIGSAVREILGEAWFDLPFDLDGRLRNWSEDDVLKPDDEMRDWSVFLGDDEYEGVE